MLADINGNLAELRSETAMTSQRFCLRWNNHQSNLLQVFDQLLHDESFVDVTIAVDGHFIRAHKMVLSACSPYFQALFHGHPDRHPIVILKDVSYIDMRSLLDFMYRGEVSVEQERLTGFLHIAEMLRIKGLTEVSEEKNEVANNTSSQSNLHNSSTPPPPPPNLHRINQAHHSIAQKRYQQMSNHPLLGSALTAPKRKRGRPRKLSGSSDTPMDTSLSDQCGVDLVQGSPEMLEMKMGLDFQSEAGPNSGASSNGSSHKREPSEPTENGTDVNEGQLVMRIKDEVDPIPTKEDAYPRSHSRQGSESYKQEMCGSSNSSIKSNSIENLHGLVAPERTSTPHQNHESSPKPMMTTVMRALANNSAVKGGDSRPGSPMRNQAIPRALNLQPTTPQTPQQPQHPSQQQQPNSQVAAAGSMTAPTGRQAPKRRMRRRATSQSQDPAEHLTEMSVRGLNLFRYASISEGVYQCTECAKVDIQKTFKNKYSFQRHAFLYHEGHQRKVFPCPVCQKEFSRPDKMKNHMKTVHDCFMPKDCVMPYSYYMPH